MELTTIVFTREELQRLHKRFLKLDRDQSGSIDSDEFRSLPAIANNPLADRFIKIFDRDGGGDVDFDEFIAGLGIFSTHGREREKLRFAFNVYDIDQDGFISNGELFIVMKTMVGNNLGEVQLQQVVDKTMRDADMDGDGKISFEDFEHYVSKSGIAPSLTLEGSGISV
ncbi:calcineurin subunit B [Ramicandelaber brevisporus]|nr:calcineurin subunit B [Ramicandelaber brevisporus]